jgi:hypothetical protein
MDKKQRMKKIVEKVGHDKAVELVMNAYNTELIASWLRHIEASQGGKVVRAAERRDHLGNALDRTVEVCGLTD